MHECGQCGTLLLEDPPTAETLKDLYPDDTYYAYHIPKRSRLSRWLRKVALFSTAAKEPALGEPGRVLDFGCGAGERLLELMQAGWQCSGVEINDRARATAREQGLDVRTSIGGPGGFPDAHFDYVRANHSLEHVPNPREVLSELCRVLKPGGTLFLGVPTASSANARLFGPHWWYLTPPLHVFVPSTGGLAQLVRSLGLRVIQTSTNSDYASTGGSLQIWLNRRSQRVSHRGLLFALRPLLLVSHWIAKLQDRAGTGDKLEMIAIKIDAP